MISSEVCSLPNLQNRTQARRLCVAPPLATGPCIAASMNIRAYVEHWTFPRTVVELGLKGMEEVNPKAWL